MKAIKCPRCKRDHALFVWVESGGKRAIYYICDKTEQMEQENSHGYYMVRMATAFHLHDEQSRKLMDSIEDVRWSEEYANEQKAKLQGNLTL